MAMLLIGEHEHEQLLRTCSATDNCFHRNYGKFCHEQTSVCGNCQSQLENEEEQACKCCSATCRDFELTQASVNWGVVPVCNACGYAVRGCEQRRHGSEVYHRGSCFKCKQCCRLLDDATVVAHTPDALCCRPCWNKQHVIASPNFCSSTKTIPCAACMLPCGSRPADVVDVGKLWLHRTCCRCSNCASPLDFQYAIEHEGRIHCRLCFIKRFATILLAGARHSTPICVECGEEAKVEEFLRFFGDVYHTACLKCTSCKERLTLTTYCADNGKLHCRNCQTAARQGSLSPAHRLGGCIEKCGACKNACYAAERVYIGRGAFHKGCLRCSKCKAWCSEMTIAWYENKLYCVARCYKTHANLVNNNMRAKVAGEESFSS